MKQKNKLSIRRFLFEFLIVFIGVYGAFELNNYQQRQREQKIRENYFTSFQSELRGMIGKVRNVEEALNAEIEELNNYRDSLKNKAFFPLNINFKESLLITQAGFNDDVFIQLSPDLASSLTGGYDYVKSLEQMTNSYNQITQMKLVGKKWGDLFTNQGELKTEYEWYRRDLNWLNANFNRVGNMMQNEAMPFVKQVVEGF